MDDVFGRGEGGHVGLRGFAKKNSKNSILLWKWVRGSRSYSDFFGGNLPKIASANIWSSIPCVFCL